MNLNVLRNTAVNCYTLDPTTFPNRTETYMFDGNVVLSAYNVNQVTGFTFYVISNTDNLQGTIQDSWGRDVIWNPTQKLSGAYAIGNALNVNEGAFDLTKTLATLNALQSKYSNLYLYSFQVPFFDVSAAGAEFTLSLSNSFYFSNGTQTEGKIGSAVAFDIGEGQSLTEYKSIFSSIGKLLEKANGDLSVDIGEPYNPIDPENPSGEVDFEIGSAGTGHGYNTYKLQWEVVTDSQTVNYAETNVVLAVSYNGRDYDRFKSITLGSGGSVDFSFMNMLEHVGDYGILDKIKEKLPIVDPSPLRLYIRFESNGAPLLATFLSCIMYYDGKLEVQTDIVNDDYGNIYKFTGGNDAGENSKKDMEDDDKYKDDDEKGDGDDKNFGGGTDGVNGSALLTTSYALTLEQIHSFGSWLWTSTMIDDIQLVNNNPIENIVSAKLFPFSVTQGTSTNVQLGNVESNVNGLKLAENVARTFTFGTPTNPLRIPKESAYTDYDFLNYAPFTTMKLYLPYLGVHELDVNEVIDRDFYIAYYVDLVTGMCRATVKVNSGSWKNIHVFDGQIGQDIPITGSNRAQVEVGYITGGLSTALNLVTGHLGSALESAIGTAITPYHSDTRGTPTPCNSRFDCQQAYIIIDRPDVPSLPSKFAHQNGRICNKTITLSNLSGYVEIDNTVDLTGVKCMESEREELLSLLSSGFYI